MKQRVCVFTRDINQISLLRNGIWRLVVESPPEEHDVWLRAMNSVVDPSTALLHSYSSPFTLPQKPKTTDDFLKLSKSGTQKQRKH